jgi:hypothetical protein
MFALTDPFIYCSLLAHGELLGKTMDNRNFERKNLLFTFLTI